MKFIDNNNAEVKLKKAGNLPGYEISISEDVIIESPLSNPFFQGLKGINILQIPKKIKGFRSNSDLQQLLDPIKINTGIKSILQEGEFVLFQPNNEALAMLKLQGSTQIFTTGEDISPLLVNYGMHEAKLKKNTVIGTIIVLHTII